MREKSGKGVAPCISVGTKFVEHGEVLINMLVRGSSVPLPASLGFRLNVPSELLNQLFEIHHQIPILMFSMTCNPNAR